MTIFPKEKTDSLVHLLDNSGRVTIVSHLNPDGDAVGSAYGWFFYLTEMLGLDDVKIVLPTPIPANLEFITGGVPYVCAQHDLKESENRIADSQLVICTDFNTVARSGCLESALSLFKGPKVLVDHHLSPNEDEFSLVFSDPSISSASELEYWILMSLPQISGDAHKLPLRCSRALMSGMTTDTNNFANSVVPSTLRMTADLLDAGVDRNAIVHELYNRYRENRVRAISYLLDNVMVLSDEGWACIVVTKELWERFGLEDGELEGMVNIPLSIDRIKMSVYVREDDGFCRISVRSKAGWSANLLARSAFHGGGHEQAAGGRLYIPDDVESVESVLDYVKSTISVHMAATA